MKRLVKKSTYEDIYKIRQTEALKTKKLVDEIINTMSDEDKEKLGMKEDESSYLTENQCGYVVKRFIYKQDDTPISFFDLLRDGDNLNVALATRSDKDYRGKGYATKLAKQAIEWCDKNKDKWDSVLWGVRYDNVASIALAEKLNFKLEKMYLKEEKLWFTYKYTNES